MTTTNLGIYAPIPKRHLCQKRYDEIEDDLQDYIKLINKVQRHTICNPSYYSRIDKKTGRKICRFRYSKEHVGYTVIREDKHGQPELLTTRNDGYINTYNRLQLQGWRANVDLKPILSIYAVLQYISKYASKAEPQSMAFSEIFSDS